MERLRVLVAPLLAVALLGTVSCGGDEDGDGGGGGGTEQPTAPPQVAMTITDSAFEISGEIESEPTQITVENETADPHFAFFARLNEGVTSEDAQKTLEQKGPGALFPQITVAGGVTQRIKPGQSGEITMLFPEGSYLAIDPETKGPPPAGFFDVAAASGPEIAEPEADYTVEAGDFYFKIEEPVAGEAAVELVNVGEQGHELSISRSPAKSEKDEVVFTLMPAPGGKAWTTLDLESDDYLAQCFFPDPKTDKPHVKLGMREEFSVQ